MDVALVHLKSPLGTYATALAANDPTLNQGLYCYGYGNNVAYYDTSVTPPVLTGTGFGTLRASAVNVVKGLDDRGDTRRFTLVPNASEQIQYTGDSGGPCFDPAGATPTLMGVFSTFHPSDPNPPGTEVTIERSGNVKAARFRDWVRGIMDPAPSTKSLCHAAPTVTSRGGRNDLAAAWNNAPNTSVAVYPSTGSSFSYWYQGLTEGGWDDRSKYASGDFDGDGLTDIATAWPDSGMSTIAVRPSTGHGFTLATWAETHMPFRSVFKWLPGDFNNDGLDDLAVAWNNQGLTSVGVFLSTGSSFLPYQAWAPQTGGWSDDDKWVVGDFDHDGRADLATVWNNGKNAIAIRRSTGSSFELRESVVNMGGWSNSTKWLGGDFNGDGYSDLAAAWKEPVNGHNLARVAVYLSTGTTFNGWNQWDMSGGGWDDSHDWTSGDFNGDGKWDLVTNWPQANPSNPNDVHNVLTVRRSTGSSFVPDHWLNPAGGYIPTSQWCAGKFTR